MIPSFLLGLVVLRIVTSCVNAISGFRNSEESFRVTSGLLAALDSLILTLTILADG